MREVESTTCNACLSIAKRFGFDIGMQVMLRANQPGEIIAVNHHDGKVHLLIAADNTTQLVPLTSICDRRIHEGA